MLNIALFLSFKLCKCMIGNRLFSCKKKAFITRQNDVYFTALSYYPTFSRQYKATLLIIVIMGGQDRYV